MAAARTAAAGTCRRTATPSPSCPRRQAPLRTWLATSGRRASRCGAGAPAPPQARAATHSRRAAARLRTLQATAPRWCARWRVAAARRMRRSSRRWSRLSAGGRPLQRRRTHPAARSRGAAPGKAGPAPATSGRAPSAPRPAAAGCPRAASTGSPPTAPSAPGAPRPSRAPCGRRPRREAGCPRCACSSRRSRWTTRASWSRPTSPSACGAPTAPYRCPRRTPRRRCRG
mmetsp:Transcript_36842/g.93096  ORF Transcript_36842/g.93096 Transcript_36842/m.93096 type:complete len:229 (-) Transcript_36842:1536-2222(-)